MSNLSQEERLEAIHECIDTVEWAWQNYLEAKTLPAQGHWLDVLANGMSDLVSWHPEYDIERGCIPREEF